MALALFLPPSLGGPATQSMESETGSKIESPPPVCSTDTYSSAGLAGTSMYAVTPTASQRKRATTASMSTTGYPLPPRMAFCRVLCRACEYLAWSDLVRTTTPGASLPWNGLHSNPTSL